MRMFVLTITVMDCTASVTALRFERTKLLRVLSSMSYYTLLPSENAEVIC